MWGFKGRGSVEGGQGGYDQRIEVFGKIQKKKNGGGVGLMGGGGVKVDVNEEWKFLMKIQEFFLGGGGSGGGCEPKIEVFVKVQKKKNFGGGGGGGVGLGGCQGGCDLRI